MGKEFRLDTYSEPDPLQRISHIMKDAAKEPGSTIIIPPGTYNLSTELAREAQKNVMTGK